jgi:hypothetical protein
MIAAALAVVLMSGRASAQTAPGGAVGPGGAAATPMPAAAFFLGVSAGGLLNTTLVTSEATATIYNQNAAVAERRDVSGGILVDVTAGVPIRPRLAIGASIARRAATSDSAIAAAIPHPLFSDTPRAVSTTITDMTSTQTWLSVLAVYSRPVKRQMTLRFFGGPALALVRHDIVAGVAATETSNVAAPTIAITTASVSKSFWGVTGGLDLSYRLNASVGLGAFVRYSGAQANVTGAESASIGGVESGVGLRFSFAKR